MVDHADITRAVETLRAGGLVAFPTETVYGLGADALNPAAVRLVYQAKGRPARNPLIVHVADADMARAVSASWPDDADRLARAFWPGPLSIVVTKSPRVPDLVTAGGDTVAIRCPDHPVALALLAAFAGPLVGPSANPSGGVSPTTARHVRDAFPDIQVLDGGPCRTGLESTVVSLSGDEPVVLRPGVIGAPAIARVLARAVRDRAAAPADGPLRSPGLLESHYAPRARVVIRDAADLALAESEPRPTVVLSFTPRPWPEGVRHVPMPADARAYAARLYAAIREADALLPATIVVERPGPGDNPADAAIWSAVLDRLDRAAAPR